MEGDALPRLQPREVVDVVPAASNGVSSVEQANSARRATKLSLARASLPKSADAVACSQRRRTGSTSGASGHAGRPAVRGYGVDPSTNTCDPAAVVFMQRQLTTPPTVVRPPSTRTGTPRKSATREAANDPQSDQHQQSQWHAMMLENEQLRLEMSRLQQQLVEKVRGHAKILVGGGQFRASAASSSLPNKQHTGMISNHPCGSCVSLRESFKKAREGFDEARDVMAFRIVELERGDVTAQSSLNQQSEELVLLRSEIARLQQADGVMRRQLHGQQKQIERLESELLAYQTAKEEALQRAALGPAEGFRDKHYANSATQSEDLESKQPDMKLIEAIQAAEAASSRLCQLQHLNTELQDTCLALRGELSTAARDHQRALLIRDQAESEMQSRLVASEDTRLCLVSQCAHVEEQLGVSSSTAAKLESELCEARSRLRDTTDEYQRQVKEKTERVDELEARELEYAALTSSLRCRVSELEGRLREDADGESIMERKIQQLTEENHTLVDLLQLRSAELKQRELEVDEIKSALSEAQSHLRVAQEALAPTQQEAENASAGLAAAEAENVAHEDLVQRLRKSHAATLEKAMQSVVRLCIVAPTVHVHVNSGSGSNLSVTGSASVTCKASLPQAQLRRVVEQEVLPLFATVFVQSHEGTSPQGTPMDTWLQSLLRDMQDSLAAHLQKLYTSTAASSSAVVNPPSISGL